ncbi:MAG: response regulator transcription factor [Trueperaceae bacterium]
MRPGGSLSSAPLSPIWDEYHDALLKMVGIVKSPMLVYDWQAKRVLETNKAYESTYPNYGFLTLIPTCTLAKIEQQINTFGEVNLNFNTSDNACTVTVIDLNIFQKKLIVFYFEILASNVVQISTELPHLTKREQQILELIISGFTNDHISRHLALNMGTIKNYVSSIFEKFNVYSRRALIDKLHAKQ